MNEETLMREALAEARLASAEGELPVGCVIAKDGVILSRAHNEREARKDPTAHAEVLALRAAAASCGDWRLTGCTLYVTLEPCPMCAGAITQARIKRVVWGAPDKRYGCAGSVYRLTEDPAFTHFCPADGGLLEEECASLLAGFFAENR